ncbi:MAG: hypothetical protein KF718_28965 [Polyangiaceae bacterium]|nr:hypothetical protein [Polyangiaceae bacterium]
MKSTLIGFSLLLVLGGCTVTNTENGDGEGGSAGQTNSGGAAGNAGSGGTSSGGTSSGGGGSTPTGCVSLCSHTSTATDDEVDCVAAQAYLQGYDWPGDPVCVAIEVDADCELCTGRLKLPDAVCANLESTCFGAGSGGSGGGSGGVPGTGGSGGGSGGTSSSVSTCGELCQFAPTVTTKQAECVELNAYLMGYNWPGEPICAASGTVPGCNACTTKLAMKDADCAALHQKCF